MVQFIFPRLNLYLQGHDSTPKCATFLSPFPDHQDNFTKRFPISWHNLWLQKGFDFKTSCHSTKAKIPQTLTVTVFFLCIYRNNENNPVNLNIVRGPWMPLFLHWQEQYKGYDNQAWRDSYLCGLSLFLGLLQEQREHWNARPENNGAQPRTSLLGHSLVVCFQAWFA